MPLGFADGIGAVTRADFSLQVTYLGRPLYTYVVDREPGQFSGDELMDEWGLWSAARQP